MKKTLTRKELIQGIFLMANVQPSLQRLAGYPLENLKELYMFMRDGDSFEIEVGEV